MKNIFVSNSKEDKSISKKLVSKLESEGYSCYVLPRDENSGKTDDLISKSRIFILVLSDKAANSKQIIEQLKSAVNHNCDIIPFKAGKINDSLGMQYMLHELEWVDAYGDGFDEAYEILLEIIEEFTDGKKIKSVKKNNAVSSDSNFEFKKSYLFGIIAVLLAVLVYVLFYNNSESVSSEVNKNNTVQTNNTVVPDVVNEKIKPEEQKIVGSWKMTGYEDSRNMTSEERRLTEQNIEQMKQSVLLTYNSDRSFVRIGFTPQAQKGYWEYDALKKKIYLIPEGTNKKEEINIINLTDKEMTFVVTESVETSPGKTEIVTTKLTFEKQ